MLSGYVTDVIKVIWNWYIDEFQLIKNVKFISEIFPMYLYDIYIVWRPWAIKLNKCNFFLQIGEKFKVNIFRVNFFQLIFFQITEFR